MGGRAPHKPSYFIQLTYVGIQDVAPQDRAKSKLLLPRCKESEIQEGRGMSATQGFESRPKGIKPRKAPSSRLESVTSHFE